MSHYYNELDPEKAEWIRELIKAGVVAPGDVDERSITDVSGDDLRSYTQCHFFAGISAWSYALRLAGWPDDRPVWTGSCPCPSFSAAGKGAGFADPRHLWPEWYRLIRECRPAVVFGEQVAAAIGYGWLDLVCTDLEASEYAIAAAVLGAHSAGAPHIRQRCYFVADLPGQRRGEARPSGGRCTQRAGERGEPGQRADAEHAERRPECEEHGDAHRRDGLGWGGNAGQRDYAIIDGRRAGRDDDAADERLIPDTASLTGDLGDPGGARLPHGEPQELRGTGRGLEGRAFTESGQATRGFWAGCDWWYGRDGKYRPIEPGLFPLAYGAPARVLRLRGYGDAICTETAKAFIQSYIEARNLVTDVNTSLTADRNDERAM